MNHSTTSTFIIPAVAYYQYSGQEEPVATFNFGQNPAFSGTKIAGTNTDSNGKGLFKYQPPSGFLALCEDNLPTPAIADPGDYFKTVLYTGDGNEDIQLLALGSNQISSGSSVEVTPIIIHYQIQLEVLV